MLVRRLARQMAGTPLPPLEREIVVVQSQGMQRWLTLRFARLHGVAGSLTTPFPRPFCRWLARRVLDGEDVPSSEEIRRGDDALFGRELLAWRLFALLDPATRDDGEDWPDPVLGNTAAGDTAAGNTAAGDAAAGDTAAGNTAADAPAAYLEQDPDQRKRFQLCLRLGALFDDYQMFRGDLLHRWEQSEETGDDPPAAVWQAALWRRLLADAGVRARGGAEPGPDAPFSHRLRRLTQRLERARRPPPGLPRRVSVLGVSTLPPAFIALLTALARWIPVGIYFVSPTFHFWGDLRSDREQARIARRLRASEVRGGADGPDSTDSPDGDEELHLERGNALLAGLGRQGRDFFNLLQDADPEGQAWHELDFRDPLTASGADGESSGSALAVLQSDILHLRDRSPEERIEPAADDSSLEIHACHSPMREMEVLRDRLLAAFDDDPTLRPQDVLVLVPDIELYGPYVQAVFGVEHRDRPHIPFSIADRRTGREQPPSETVLDLLDLVGSRLRLSEVFDLLDVPAVRRAFGLETGELPELRRLAERAGIRWGMDGAHRARSFDVPAEGQNTWRAGLDRWILGYATGDVESLVSSGERDILPFAGDTAGGAEALGRFAAFCDVLFEILRDLGRRRTLSRWADALGRAVDRLFAGDDEEEERGLQLVRDALDELRRVEERAGVEGEVDLRVAREHLGRRLGEESYGSGFLAGKVTFCALRPMRTIPFRLIAVAGLDDGAFPRRDRRPGFDLMARHPRPGDRSLRDDDRYLFLETLLAAEDRLLLSYVGFSQRHAAAKEPSVVLAELLDQVDRTFVHPGGVPARCRFVREHRLQPWSAAYFAETPAGGDAAVEPSFSVENCLAARALGGEGHAIAPFVAPFFRGEIAPPQTEAETEPERVELRRLLEFWRAPSRYFLRRVLGVELSEEGGEEADAEPFAVGELEGFALRLRLLERRLQRLERRLQRLERRLQRLERQEAGSEEDLRDETELRLLRAAGKLPAGAVGEAAWRAQQERVDALLERLPEHRRLPPRDLAVSGEGWRLEGRIDRLSDRGLLRFRPGSIRPVDRLGAWIELLALLAGSDPSRSEDASQALLLGEDGEVCLRPPANPLSHLETLVRGYLEGRRRPLPFFPRASWAYAEQARKLEDPTSRARKSARREARDVFEGHFFRGRPGGRERAEADDPHVRLAFRAEDPVDSPALERWARRVVRPILEGMEERS